MGTTSSTNKIKMEEDKTTPMDEDKTTPMDEDNKHANVDETFDFGNDVFPDSIDKDGNIIKRGPNADTQPYWYDLQALNLNPGGNNLCPPFNYNLNEFNFGENQNKFDFTTSGLASDMAKATLGEANPGASASTRLDPAFLLKPKASKKESEWEITDSSEEDDLVSELNGVSLTEAVKKLPARKHRPPIQNWDKLREKHFRVMQRRTHLESLRSSYQGEDDYEYFESAPKKAPSKSVVNALKKMNQRHENGNGKKGQGGGGLTGLNGV